MKGSKYITVKQASELFNWPLGGLRGLLFRRHKNGLSKAIIKIGNRIMIDVEEFESWLNDHKEI